MICTPSAFLLALCRVGRRQRADAATCFAIGNSSFTPFSAPHFLPLEISHCFAQVKVKGVAKLCTPFWGGPSHSPPSGPGREEVPMQPQHAAASFARMHFECEQMLVILHEHLRTSWGAKLRAHFARGVCCVFSSLYQSQPKSCSLDALATATADANKNY